MSRKSLFDIPEKLFHSYLFPSLLVNELLRLRRVCKWTKNYSEEYFRLHPRSKRLIWLDLHGFLEWEDDNDDYDVNFPVEPFKFNLFERSVPLETFLDQDSKSTIRMPVARFRLSYKYSDTLGCDLVSNFLEKYGGQIVHLEMSNARSPFSDSEIPFLEKLPKLTSLQIICFSYEPHRMKWGVEYPYEVLKNLKRFEIPEVTAGFNFDSLDFTLTHLRKCSNLEYLCVAGELTSHPKKFKELCDILQHFKHLKFKFGRLELESRYKNWESKVTPLFCDVAVQGDVKLVDIDANIFYSFDKHQLEQIALQLMSLRNYELTYCHNLATSGVAFPNVEEVDLNVTKIAERDPKWKRREVKDFVRRSLSPDLFPGLKKLKIRIPHEDGCPRVLSLVWKNVLNLEEIVFTSNSALQDVTFIGDSGDCPLLNLTKLKKLDLGDLSADDLTDSCFSKLRKLKIRLPPENGPARIFSFAWSDVLQLKRAEFAESCANQEDITFVGVSKDCLFLSLTKLMKQEAEDISRDKLSDVVFQKVFRNMKLHELKMLSKAPLTSITGDGIRALQTGPFMETIESFSFRGWSLANMDTEEFLQLSRQFPNNQEL